MKALSGAIAKALVGVLLLIAGAACSATGESPHKAGEESRSELSQEAQSEGAEIVVKAPEGSGSRPPRTSTGSERPLAASALPFPRARVLIVNADSPAL